MTVQIENLLTEIEKAIVCDEVGGDILPLPPSSLPDKNSLVVNCFFKPEKFIGSGNELLDRCRNDTGKALEAIAQFIKKRDVEFDIVGVSILKIDESGQNIRVYWANSRKDMLSDVNCAITSEGSHVNELSSLLAG